MYNPVQVASRLINLGMQSGNPLTHMQLQKLTYIAHGYHLAITGAPLLNEPVAAWKYGPVIPAMYDAFKAFGNSGIKVPPDVVSNNLDTRSLNIIDAVYNIYGQNDGIKLSELTHRPGTPWSQSYNGYMFTVIPNETIKNYYKGLISNQVDCNGL